VTEQPDLLDITEASDLVHIPVATLRYLRSRGEGPRAFRLGRRVMYKRKDCLDYVERAYNQPLRT